MSQFLSRKSMLNAQRKNRFSVKFMKDLEGLVSMVSNEITEKHIKDVNYARRLNISLAFFIHDALSLMDRGFVFSLIKTYLKKFQLSIKDLNLTEFRLDFLRIVCSHEHLVTLNLPLGAALYPAGPGSQHSSPSSSISSTLENLDAPNVEAMGELSSEFRTYHYLTGLVLTELALVLDGKNSKLREQAVEVVRDLLASHDSDSRYNKPSARARIASLYLPLLSIVMDNFQCLYKGADGWEDWSTTFERNASVRRSVVVKEGADGSWEIEGQEPPETAKTNDHLLGPVSTRNLLICFLWVLKNIDMELLKSWWSQLSISRFNILVNVLDLSVACFEYRPGSRSGPGSSEASLQGKRNLQHQTSTGGPVQAATPGNRMRNQLANAILGGEGTARDMLARRKKERGGMQQSEALRWGKTYWQATSEQAERPVVDIEVDAYIEGSLAAESSLIVLDTMELLMQTISARENLHSTLGRALEVLLHLMATNQSVQVMKDVFSTQRAIVWKFPDLLFYEETEQCAELCRRLLRHCSSGVKEIRTWACASLYLLMRHDFEQENSFARVKVQATVALSTIVAGSTTFNEHHLRRSLKTIMLYGDNDRGMEDSSFPEQVRELSINLHHILLDTVKMQEFQDDPEMLMDLMYRISKGYKNSPDLRLTWLQAMAEKNSQMKNHTEAAMCLVHAAALVSEYLYLLEGKSYLPIGCVAFQNISPNVLEESATSEDTLAPEEEGICTGKMFSEQGLIGLMEQAAALFKEAQLYEAMNEVYRLVMPIYEERRAYQSLEKVHRSLSDCYQQLLHKGSHRFLGTYFRVGFYGLIFGDLDRAEFVYKEAALTQLGEFSLRLQNLYSEKLGKDKIELLKDSKTIDPSTLDPAKGHIQVTFVEPYFEEWELKERLSVFDRSFNIRRFVFNTPYTKGGKAHGEIDTQCMSKTILITKDTLPYVKKRSTVINFERVEMNPLQVAIIGMQEKIISLRNCLIARPPDTKLLQMRLQGGIATTVNQGPFAIAKCFLDVPLKEQTHDHHRLRVCFKEFARRCQEALDLNKHLITEEQHEYQHELARNFRDFQNKLEPMVPTKKKHKRSRDRALKNIATARTSRLFSTGSTGD
ncbi:Dedicator of cytokinesis protein 7 [Geodia barretti]|uniref:Dedicator of cytokinesis protein 7 n=4 Tax=Geodia barretti TaxID=519541 RepID=A0AA35RC43_GEOBA|nr:Dedicator of cytokinesis protein 7 [Geodia barretti]